MRKFTGYHILKSDFVRYIIKQVFEMTFFEGMKKNSIDKIEEKYLSILRMDIA